MASYMATMNSQLNIELTKTRTDDQQPPFRRTPAHRRTAPAAAARRRPAVPAGAERWLHVLLLRNW